MKKLLLIFICCVLLLSACSQPQTETGIDLYGTYDANDLLIDEIVQPLEDDTIRIPVIKGLKDTSIQDKINKEIHTQATALIERYPDINYANYYTRANFANVISISFSVGFEEAPYSESIYFNYNLVDGSKLKLEDLFTKDANLTDIIRHAIYNEMALYGGYDKETYVHYPDESAVFKVTKGYLNSENKAFAFSPTGIYLYPKEHFAEIKMLDYADCITIYSKFLTKDSIFTGEYPGFKNAFTCSDTRYDMFEEIEYGYLENNMWYDFTIGYDYIPQNEAGFDAEKVEKYTVLKQDMYQKFYSLIEDYRKIATDNPDRFYMVLFKPSCSLYISSEYKDGKWFNTFSNLASALNAVYIYEMPLEVYENSFKDVIIDAYRYEFFAMRGGAYLFEDELPEGVSFKTKENSYLYNYITGEEYTSLNDIFFDDISARNSIEALVAERLSYQDDLPKDINSLIKEMTITLDGTRIIAAFPSAEDLTITMWLDDFDKSMMKIFD